MNGRCKLHGGKSTGPRTEAGREAIRNSNRRRKAKLEIAASA
ncbi:HGGxSTG domain-containing protein [Legionella sp.]